MRAVTLGVLCAVIGCSPSALNGSRATSDVDRGAAVEASFACYPPTLMALEGAAVADVVPPPVVLAKGATGPLLLENDLVGDFTTFNHWTSPHGDHFFSGNSSVGTETIIAADRSAAVRFVRGPVAFHGNAYALSTDANGITRPSGIPMSIQTCVPSAVATQRKAQGAPAFTRKNVLPLSSATVSDRSEWRPGGCSVDGREVVKSTTWLHQFYWVPTGVFRSANGAKTYVTFNPGRVGGAWLLYELVPNADGTFDFEIGAVSFHARHHVPPGKEPRVSVTAKLVGGPDLEMICNYFGPS